MYGSTGVVQGTGAGVLDTLVAGAGAGGAAAAGVAVCATAPFDVAPASPVARASMGIRRFICVPHIGAVPFQAALVGPFGWASTDRWGAMIAYKP